MSIGDYVASEVDAIATTLKSGTSHEDHDGWEWRYPGRVLRCGCGDQLFPVPAPRPGDPA